MHVAVTTETELHDTEGAGPPTEDTEEDRSPGRGAYSVHTQKCLGRLAGRGCLALSSLFISFPRRELHRHSQRRQQKLHHVKKFLQASQILRRKRSLPEESRGRDWRHKCALQGKARAGRCWLRIQHKTTLLGTGGLEYATVNQWSGFRFCFLIYPLSSAL